MNAHRLAAEDLGVGLVLDQRSGRCECVVAAGADRGDAVLGFEDVAVAGEDQGHVLVGDDHHRFEVAEELVGSPVLGELDRGAQELALVRFEFALEALEQRERVGSRTGEPADDAAVA